MFLFEFKWNESWAFLSSLATRMTGACFLDYLAWSFRALGARTETLKRSRGTLADVNVRDGDA